ncbi:c-type cytochrome [Rhizobium sp. BR 315]|uniref:c-type cytochrome n=1 Tax=Rhizobium sp. BR 315 TaxID=3040014 RepID=UPI003D34E309
MPGSDNAGLGQKVFAGNCASCHGWDVDAVRRPQGEQDPERPARLQCCPDCPERSEGKNRHERRQHALLPQVAQR